MSLTICGAGKESMWPYVRGSAEPEYGDTGGTSLGARGAIRIRRAGGLLNRSDVNGAVQVGQSSGLETGHCLMCDEASGMPEASSRSSLPLMSIRALARPAFGEPVGRCVDLEDVAAASPSVEKRAGVALVAVHSTNGRFEMLIVAPRS